MRFTGLLSLVGLLAVVAAPAPAAPARPHVKQGAPYPDARAALIRQGLDPVRVRPKTTEHRECQDIAWSDVCAAYGETMNCFADVPVCEFLFRRRADGRYWTIQTVGEPPEQGRAPMRALRYDMATPTPGYDLRDFTILKPATRRLRSAP